MLWEWGHYSDGGQCARGHRAQLWEWHCVVCCLELQSLVIVTLGSSSNWPSCCVGSLQVALFFVWLPITVLPHSLGRCAITLLLGIVLEDV